MYVYIRQQPTYLRRACWKRQAVESGASNRVLQRSFVNIFLNDLAERVNSMLMTWQRR